MVDSHPKPSAHIVEIAKQIRPSMTQLYVMYFRIAAQSSLTGPQLSIMTRLREEGPMRISQIAREEGIRMPTASNALHQLEQRDLVHRIRDEHDRRGVLVELTPAGETELEEVGQERELQLANMLASLDEADQERLDEFVDIVKRLADAYGKLPDSSSSE